MKKQRNKHRPGFKAKIALEAVKEETTIAEIARRHKLNANTVYKWKKQLLDKLPEVFEDHSPATESNKEREEELLQKIGELTMERDFLSQGLGRYR